ncbi:MAG: DUF2087 domain-containing protein [Chloroflexi bacterium]|nr:DUF2087 domain-containing protein [Chloroflexota bacterium]
MSDVIAIDADAFKERLADLCLRPRPGLPRKRRDRHVLLRSILHLLDADGLYSEEEINVAIRDWLHTVAPRLRVDHVQLRRALVDHGYLSRTSDGAAYMPCQPEGIRFAPEIAGLRPAAIVEAGRRRMARKRALHLRADDVAAKRGAMPDHEGEGPPGSVQ